MSHYKMPGWLSFIFLPILILSFIASASADIKLTATQKTEIGHKIWQNEGLKKIDYLTVWNEGEDFPSFGIGHFIWYPPGVEQRFIEQFPQFISFAEQKRTLPPRWLLSKHNSPWLSRQEFYKAFNSNELQQLRAWLADNVDIQIEFILSRMEQALPKMLIGLNEQAKTIVHKRFYDVANHPNGAYALIDYINFKGEGTSVTERYNNQGWGLLQVLENINPDNNDIMDAFRKSADFVLTRRVNNAPRDEQRWLAGWRKRIQTYTHPTSQ